MKLKIGFLVRRKIRRWSEGKGPLTKEQLDCLDTHVLATFYDNSRIGWYLEQEDHNRIFSDLKEEKKDGNSYIYGE